MEKPPTQAEKDARKALSIGNADAIIDIKVTANENQDAEMSRAGYTQLLQEAYDPRSKSLTTVGASTFGNKASLWTWRRSGGTCSGRLKPIVDIQLARNPESTNLVLSGYTCDPTPINGQWLWIKRAASDDEEMDAVVDLYVTTGKMKNTSDPIWSSPGVGWIRVDGNFSKTGVFTSSDALLWFHPFRSRSVEKQMASPIRAVVALTEEERQTRLLYAVRVALRHHVEAADVKRLANITIMDAVSGAGETADRQASIVRSERLLDFTAMFHKVLNSMNYSIRLLHFSPLPVMNPKPFSFFISITTKEN